MTANECVELMKKMTNKTTQFFEGARVDVWLGYVDLTCEMAVALLTLSQHNFRGITRSRVDKNKKILREGQWMLHHQGISVTSSKTGLCDRLGDGQHRLKAFVEVCREDENELMQLPVLVSIGLPECTEDAVDQQQKRNCKQILKHMGLTKGNQEIEGAARVVINHFNARRFQRDHLPVSDQGLCHFVMRHEQKWLETLEIVSKPQPKDNIYPRAQMMALVFIATGSTVHRIEWSDALNTFISKFWEGLRIESKEDPFQKLRAKCRELSNKDEQGKKKNRNKDARTSESARIVWASWNRFEESGDGTFALPQLGKVDHPLNVKLIAGVEHFTDPLLDELPNYKRFKNGQNIRQRKNRYGKGWS